MPTIEGTIERIVFRNEENGYTIARLTTSDRTRLFRDDLVTIVGALPQLTAGELVECTGEWIVDPQHGRQFRVTRFVPHTPVSPKALARYLGSGIIKGIGPKTADRIVEYFGEQTLAVIELEPERLIEVKGISPAKREAIAQGWADQIEVRRIMVFLQDHNISPSLAKKIYATYGQEAIPVIQANPYQLERDIHGVGFKTADAIAQEMGMPHDSVPRLETGIKHVLDEATNDGHCFLMMEELLIRAADTLGVDGEKLPAAIEVLRRDKEIFIEDERVFLGAFFHSENGVARRIKRLRAVRSNLPPIAPAIWSALLAETGLAERQQAALRMMYDEKVSILTGGPGTGKTTTIRALVNILDRQGIRYALAAPTGRAARRMTEATGSPARTIHRLLEFIPNMNTFARNEAYPLEEAFIVLDEISMVDLVLFYNVLKALQPTAHLVLVGDADQLPSVGAGNVLHDLLSSGAVPATQLTELFRQAAESQIIVSAHQIRQGEMPETKPMPSSDFFFMPRPDAKSAAALIEDLLMRRLPKAYGLNPTRDVQVLAPMYKGAAGIADLNVMLQSALNSRPGTPEVTLGAQIFRVGDKVIQTINDYDKGIFNGDVGVISGIETRDEIAIVEFGEGALRQVVTYEFHELDALRLAYAVSIHRAQGSEYPAVVIPLVMQHSLLLQRNLLYTAITRAKRLCIIVGEEKALWKAVNNDEVRERNTALAERLRSSPIWDDEG